MSTPPSHRLEIPVTTDIDLDAIEARTNAATPGPWGVGNGDHIVRGLEVTGSGSFTCIQSVATIDDEDDRMDWDRDEAVEVDPEADAEFIAEARTDVPVLAAEVRRLRAEWDRLVYERAAMLGVIRAAVAWRQWTDADDPAIEPNRAEAELIGAVDALAKADPDAAVWAYLDGPDANAVAR